MTVGTSHAVVHSCLRPVSFGTVFAAGAGVFVLAAGALRANGVPAVVICLVAVPAHAVPAAVALSGTVTLVPKNPPQCSLVNKAGSRKRRIGYAANIRELLRRRAVY